MRFFLLLLLPALLLAAPAAHADEESPPAPSHLGEVLARLALDAPAERAWGCYLAGRDGHEQAVPQILDVLRTHAEKPDKTWRLVHRAALDAIIRLDARIPDALLAQHERHSIHVLILRARDPAAHVDVFRTKFDKLRTREKFGKYGVAIGNLLLQVRAGGFAAQLLDTLRAKMEVQVYDPGPSPNLGIGAGGVMGGFGDGMARVPEGFPPYVWYGLKGGGIEKRAGCTLLADGPRPVYVLRRERASGGLAVGGSAWYLDPTEVCVEWIAALLGTETKALGFEDHAYHHVQWTGPEAYVASVTKERRELLDPYWAMARRLHDARLLTRAEARGLQLKVAISLQDLREDKSTALPKVPPPSRPAWTQEPAR